MNEPGSPCACCGVRADVACRHRPALKRKWPEHIDRGRSPNAGRCPCPECVALDKMPLQGIDDSFQLWLLG